MSNSNALVNEQIQIKSVNFDSKISESCFDMSPQSCHSSQSEKQDLLFNEKPNVNMINDSSKSPRVQSGKFEESSDFQIPATQQSEDNLATVTQINTSIVSNESSSEDSSIDLSPKKEVQSANKSTGKIKSFDADPDKSDIVNMFAQFCDVFL